MLTKIFEAQQEDTTLKAVVNYLEKGWPDKKKMSQALLSYWHVKDELGVQNGLLMRSCRLVIPASMKLEILDKLHAGHFGITKTRLRAHETVWWPGISEEIAETVRKCSVCIQEAVSKHEPLIPTNFPTRPWQRIGMDLFKFENKWYLVVIDYYSRFPEMIQLDRLTASVVVRTCKSIFARHGIPETVVSDNGTQFGAAQAGVKIAKLILKKNQDPSLGLLEYRSTPLENGYSPAELLMGRKLRTTLPIAPENLNPKLVDSQTLKRKEGRRRKDMKSRYDRRCGATDMEELSEAERDLGCTVHVVQAMITMLCRLPPRLHGRVDIEVRLASGNTGPRGPKISQTPPYRRVDRIVDAKGREEESKEPMKSDPDSESGENNFPKKENTLGKTQEIVLSQEDVTPPPPVSDVLGRLTTTLHQLSAVTGHRERWNRYDGSYEAQSFFTNYDAQADRAQLQYSTRLRKPANLLQAPLRVINTRAYVTCSPDHL
ncbi:K02A2.6-like [Cordylochernes scorpioides]|uniref:RNA-directed DNA polymerase n=1 Tax=Cordylochernes scorpioides TaxID=51811 RepID=A0ABY6KHS0_9ARAC|nr:K02A2.6-like [Cordylochernes scorpioides]